MATALNLDPDTLRYLDDLVARGRYDSREDAVREGMRLVHDKEWEDGEADLDSLDPATRAAIERGLADVRAGRTRPAEEVFRELRAKFGLQH